MMEIDGYELRIDFRAELEAFDWDNPEWRPEKLMARSPFRNESHRSFYVYLEDTATAEAGSWGDSGAHDEALAKGGFVRLLALMKNESTESVAEYLKSKYAVGYVAKHIDDLALQPHPTFKLRDRIGMDRSGLEPLRINHSYLNVRGITDKVKFACETGFDRDNKAVSIPWFDERGRLITIKFRSIGGKMFWYHDDGADIRPFLWGMNFIYEYRLDWAVLVEAEIDAMYLISCGIPAIATGNKYFNEKRRDRIVKSPIKRLIIGQDNDAAGELMKEQVIRWMSGRVDLASWKLPAGVKDINEVKDFTQISQIVEGAEKVERRAPLKR